MKELIQFQNTNFRSQNYLFILINKKDKKEFNHYDLCLIKNFLDNTKRNIPKLDSIISPFDIKKILKKKNRYSNLSSINLICDGKSLTELNKKISNPELIPRELKKLFFSDKADAVGIVLNFLPSPHHRFFGNFDYRPIDEVQSYFNSVLPHQNFEVSFGGPGYFEWFYWKSLFKDQVLNFYLCIFLVFIFYCLFGTFKSGIIISGLIGLGSLILFSLMGYLNTPITILTNSTIIILAFSTTEDFVFLSQSQLDKKRPTKLWEKDFQEYLTPSFLTSLTTIIGFGSLYISDLKSIQDFGLTVSIGALIEWILLFFIFPAFIKNCSFLRSWTKKEPSIFNLSLKKIPSFPFQFKTIPPVLIKFLLHSFLLLSLYFINTGKSIENIKTTWPASHEFSKSLEKIETYLKWSTFIEVSFPTDESINPILTKIKELKHVVKIEDHEDFLNIGVSNLDLQAQSYFKGLIKTSDRFDRYLSKDKRFIRKFIYLNSTNSIEVDSIRNEIFHICNQKCLITGKAIFHSYFSKLVSDTFKNSFILCFIIICLFIFVLCSFIRSNFSFELIYSSLWGVIVFIGFISFTLGGVSFVTCIFSSSLLGLAGDNAIQFLWASRSQPKQILESMIKRKIASIKVTIIMIVSISIFMFSEFLQIRILGALFIVGSIMLLFGDIWILKFLVFNKTKKSF